jgi:poly(3-hydroxybutyrate) depolymerase
LLYHAHELAHALLAPLRLAGAAQRLWLDAPFNPFGASAPARRASAAWEVFEHVVQRRERPTWGIETIVANGARVTVHTRLMRRDRFCELRRFVRTDSRGLPRLLVVAPLSGHYPTLLRDTVRTLLAEHEVYVTEWCNARDIPPAAGPFGFEDYVDYVIAYLRELAPECHVLAVCQPAVPVLAATAVMAAADDPAVPATMTLIGGPIDTRRSPTVPNDLATGRPLAWFEDNLIACVPAPYAGRGRRVYPGFLQLAGFISMNMHLHVRSHREFFDALVRGDGDGPDAHRRFYDEYLAVMDLPAEFYLDTIERVFQRHAIATGALTHRGARVDPGAITRTALLTIEGGRDDISGPGQTAAALALCRHLRAEQKAAYVHPGVGHYGTFSGRRWRKHIAPRIAEFIRTHARRTAAARPGAHTPRPAGAGGRRAPHA